jgi:RNA polymerase sigma factor for flagellar operon FliA
MDWSAKDRPVTADGGDFSRAASDGTPQVKESTMPSVKGTMRIGGRSRLGSRQHMHPPRRSSLDELPIQDVFQQYKKTPTNELRNYLMEKFLPLVRFNAERIHTRLPDEVDVEDLMSAGVFGLMDAIDNFKLEYKVKFETYCAPRIRGAILDELRSMDWVPRLVRHRTAKVDAARQQIEMESGVPADDRQIAERLGIPMDDFDKYKRDSVARNTRSLSARCFPSDGSRDVREIDVIKDETQINPISEMHRRDLRDLITRGLHRAERLIVILYYYEGMTMKEIGATLDLSESRVSQMHSSILERLKAQMQHRSRELEPVE